jgi:hypothetical protein
VGFLFYGKKSVRTKPARTLQEQRTRVTKLEWEEIKMADQVVKKKAARTLSLDGWAVAIALLLAALVRLGVLKHVGW